MMKTYNDVPISNEMGWDMFTQTPVFERGINQQKQRTILKYLEEIARDIEYINEIDDYSDDHSSDSEVDKKKLSNRIMKNLNKVKLLLNKYTSTNRPFIFDAYALTFDDFSSEPYFNALFSLSYTLKKRVEDYYFVKQWKSQIKEITTTIFNGLANYFLYSIEH